MLYWYGVKLGLQSIMHGHLSREVAKSIIVPANYWRTLEFRLVTEALTLSPEDVSLDIGSPKLLSLYVADRLGARVVSTDIEPYFLGDFAKFRDLRGIPEERFKVLVADGRHLEFPDSTFTSIFSVSVLEHIPGDGDTECIREVARTLAPGGRCAITVPFAPEARDEFRPAKDFYWAEKSVPGAAPEMVFFQRWYDQPSLETRLITPSGLSLERIVYFGERFHLGGTRQIGNFFPPITGAIHPLMSRIFHVTSAVSWKELPNPLGALLVLTKGAVR